MSAINELKENRIEIIARIEKELKAIGGNKLTVIEAMNIFKKGYLKLRENDLNPILNSTNCAISDVKKYARFSKGSNPFISESSRSQMGSSMRY